MSPKKCRGIFFYTGRHGSGSLYTCYDSICIMSPQCHCNNTALRLHLSMVHGLVSYVLSAKPATIAASSTRAYCMLAVCLAREQGVDKAFRVHG